MRYLYVFLMIIGALSSLLGVILFWFDFSAGYPKWINDFGMIVVGLVLIVLGDMGSKLSNLRSDFDFFLAQQRRPSQRFLHRTDDETDASDSEA